MSSILQQAFGKSVDNGELDLYADVFQVERTCTPAQLRKAYYQRALQYHPDKNPSEDAKLKFQALSWTYNVLKDPEKRADYDNEGIIPHDDEMDDDGNDDDDSGRKTWKNYFDLIFGKVTTSEIDAFAMKYKMSEEEEKDVLKYWVEKKGNLLKMLEFVMLSELRDVPRWVEDYIQPALAAKSIPSFPETFSKTLKQVEKKLEKQRQEEGDNGDEAEVEVEAVAVDNDNDDETETEESEDNLNVDGDDDEEDFEEETNHDKKKSKGKASKKVTHKDKISTKGSSTKASPKKAAAGKATAKKGNKTSTKKSNPVKKTKKQAPSQQDLIAAIRNKNRSNPFSSIGARYGVSMEEDDPLDDAQFAKIQSKFKKKKQKA